MGKGNTMGKGKGNTMENGKGEYNRGYYLFLLYRLTKGEKGGRIENYNIP